MNQVIDKNARERREGLDWKDFGKEAVCHGTNGFCGNGGTIPYTGKYAENYVREHWFDEKLT